MASGSEILRRAPGELLLSVHPVDIMFIKFYFTFKEKIVPSNYVSLTCQFLKDALTDRVPIILTDPVPWIPQWHGLSLPSSTCWEHIIKAGGETSSGKVHSQQDGGGRFSFNHNSPSNWASSKDQTHVKQEISEVQRCKNTEKDWEKVSMLISLKWDRLWGKSPVLACFCCCYLIF